MGSVPRKQTHAWLSTWPRWSACERVVNSWTLSFSLFFFTNKHMLTEDRALFEPASNFKPQSEFLGPWSGSEVD